MIKTNEPTLLVQANLHQNLNATNRHLQIRPKAQVETTNRAVVVRLIIAVGKDLSNKAKTNLNQATTY